MQQITFTGLQVFTDVYSKRGTFADLHSLLRSVNRKPQPYIPDALRLLGLACNGRNSIGCLNLVYNNLSIRTKQVKSSFKE